MMLRDSGGTILKRTGRGVVGAALGSVVPVLGTIIGFAVGASLRGKKDSVYWECPKCGYFRFLAPGEKQS
jgi:phage tail tape-measure protein